MYNNESNKHFLDINSCIQFTWRKAFKYYIGIEGVIRLLEMS